MKSSCWSPIPRRSPSRPTAGTSASSTPPPPTSPFPSRPACSTDYPMIIPLTNGVPFVVPSGTSAFAAPPGTAAAVLLRLSHQQFRARGPVRALQLVRQRRPGAPAGCAPDHGALLRRQLLPRHHPGTDCPPDQLRRCPTCAAIGIWGFTTTSCSTSPTPSAPSCPTTMASWSAPSRFRLALTPLNPPHGLLLSWNSVEGERYFVQYTASLAAPVTWTNIGFVTATTPLTTFEVLPVPTAPAFFRIVQVFSSRPRSTSSSGPPTRSAFPGPPRIRATPCNPSSACSDTWANAGLPPVTDGRSAMNTSPLTPSAPVRNIYRLIK